jgi:hypothetical protein
MLAAGQRLRWPAAICLSDPNGVTKKVSGLFLTSKKQITIMNAQQRNRTRKTEKQESVSDAATLRQLESTSIPIGTFAGTEDRIIRTRDGQIIPADTGDQGGGQN